MSALSVKIKIKNDLELFNFHFDVSVISPEMEHTDE